MAKNPRISLVALYACAAAVLALSSIAPQQRTAAGQASDTKDELAQNFLAEHEIGHRFHIDPNDLPAPKTGPIVTDRSLVIPFNGQSLQVPPDFAAEMVPLDPLVGEFRVHYAGFFDPGFGYAGAGGRGARAVLEVRSREVPFILEHGQIVGRLVYEKMVARPEKLYGTGIGSNYQAQGLKLSKHFRS